MKSRPLLFILFSLVWLLLSACRTVVATVVNSDGSGELHSEVVFTAEEKESFAQSPENGSKSICDNFKADLPPDAVFTEEEREGETHCIITRMFANLNELRQLYSGMGNVTINELKFEIGKLTYDVEVELPAPDSSEAQPIAAEWRLTVPGEIGDHNADQVEGQTLIWALTPGAKTHLRAESSVGLFNLAALGVGGAVLLFCACLLVLGGVGMLLALRRPKRASPPAAPAA